MASEREYQRIITRGDTVIYENNKYYLVRRKSIKSDDIYPKKDWTLREVMNDIGETADNL
jgi:signal peptidase I